MRAYGKCNQADLSGNKNGAPPRFLCFFNLGICDIISAMKNKFLCILSVTSCLTATAACANWQYPGTYVGDGAYIDDGSRFTISVRGGAAMGFGSVKNEVGTLVSAYYMSPDGSQIISEGFYETCKDGSCADYSPAGSADIGMLKPVNDFSEFSFAAGASIGWTIPNRPQWRIEAGWDHIAESSYNSSPMFQGDIELSDGSISGIYRVTSGGVRSDVTTDIVSVMAFYDFYDGLYKPTRAVIPYVGFGIGYADSKTVLHLADLFGDLSMDLDLRKFGELDEYGLAVQFYRSEKSTGNVAGLLAAGVSYGITETLFLDFGARLTYIPKVKWALSNEAGTEHRDWFSVENMIYANIMLGLRFEF